jgi:hypothetical protein
MAFGSSTPTAMVLSSSTNSNIPSTVVSEDEVELLDEEEKEDSNKRR